MSERYAPARVPKLQVPLNMYMRLVALIDFMLKTVVRYTRRFVDVPIVPSFSNVSFPTHSNRIGLIRIQNLVG